jgi:hypothetical protein
MAKRRILSHVAEEAESFASACLSLELDNNRNGAFHSQLTAQLKPPNRGRECCRLLLPRRLAGGDVQPHRSKCGRPINPPFPKYSD